MLEILVSHKQCSRLTMHNFSLPSLITTSATQESTYKLLSIHCLCIIYQDDLTTTLVQQCRESQYTVQRIVETAGDNEALLFEALNVNDEIQKVLTKFEDMKKPSEVPREPEPAMIPVAVEPDDSPRIGREDALIRKPAGSQTGVQAGNNDEMMDDLDEMIFGKKAGGSSEAAHDTKKTTKDDLISF